MMKPLKALLIYFIPQAFRSYTYVAAWKKIVDKKILSNVDGTVMGEGKTEPKTEVTKQTEVLFELNFNQR